MQETIEQAPQDFSIMSNTPLKCGERTCIVPINNNEPFMFISARSGRAVFFHLRCIGINAAASFTDPNYRTHIRKVIVDRFHRPE